MGLRRNNTRYLHRKVYPGKSETITLLKRDDGLAAGTFRSLKIFQCLIGYETKQGQWVHSEETTSHTAVWQIFVTELKRVGVTYINPLDRIVRADGSHWQPESTTTIDLKLFRNAVHISCLRVDPPGVARGPK